MDGVGHGRGSVGWRWLYMSLFGILRRAGGLVSRIGGVSGVWVEVMLLRFERPTLSGGENVAGDVLHGNAGVSIAGERPSDVESGGAGPDVVTRRVAVRLLQVGTKVLCTGGAL